MIRKCARPIVLAVLATSLLAFAAPPAAAQPERPTDSIAAPHITVTSAQLEDLALYAASTGRTVDSVVAQFAGSDRFAALVDEVRSRYPSEFVFAQWGVGSGTLIVRPGGAASVEPLRAATSVAITVLERDVPNEEEQIALSARVGESLRGSGVAVGTWFDVDRNRVVVDVPTSSGKRVVEAQLSATPPLKWGGKDVPVDVVVRSDRSWTPATAEGRATAAALAASSWLVAAFEAFRRPATARASRVLMMETCWAFPLAWPIATYDGRSSPRALPTISFSTTSVVTAVRLRQGIP